MNLYSPENEQEVKNYSGLYARGKDRTLELSPEFINTLNNVTERLYNRFVATSSIVAFVDGQPYENLEQMQDEFFRDGVLRVSQDHNESPIFSKKGNLYNRALHDYLHCILSAPFTYEGEKRVYEATIKMMPEEFHKVMFSEFVLQTAYTVNHGEFPVQKVVY